MPVMQVKPVFGGLCPDQGVDNGKGEARQAGLGLKGGQGVMPHGEPLADRGRGFIRGLRVPDSRRLELRLGGRFDFDRLADT
jgi:hypothetical protein